MSSRLLQVFTASRELIGKQKTLGLNFKCIQDSYTFKVYSTNIML